MVQNLREKIEAFEREADGCKPSVLSDLLGCPFCGTIPIIEPWLCGDPPKRLISCANEYCYVEPSVSGETLAVAIAKWNRRAT